MSRVEHVSSPLYELRAAIQSAAVALRDGGGEAPAQLRVERPKRAGQGDYSTNVAMLLAPVLGAAPREIADRVGAELAARLGDELSRWEVAGPGFLNLTMSDAWFRRALGSILAAGDTFGSGGADPPLRILVEFVSANPTGPLVAASGGRAGAYGDALARILEHQGHSVQREYYVNDAGTQIRLLGESVQARARGEEVPEGGYQGEYVRELAERIADVESLSVQDASDAAVALLLEEIRSALERYRVHFDRFFSERSLYEGSPSLVQRGLKTLAQAGHTYRSEGALWLRTSDFGDEKDRVLERSDGQPTYFTSDIGYMLSKLERGFELQLVPVGADHHGYVARIKAAFQALGGAPDAIELPLQQFVHLIEGSERAKMSKRRGDFITLDQLVDEIGVDASRYFMLQRSHDRTVDLDLDLARRESTENPVYYIQYAHARIVTMLGKLGPERVASALQDGLDWGTGDLHDAERTLIKALTAFPEEVDEAALRRGPHRIAAYALELAQEFTAFYRDCKVIGAEPRGVESFRIALSQSARQTIALALGLLGVSAPDSM
jgi:arginyl-tRNA synthetase